ncbi:MAG: oxidative damage protection protein [Thermoanaerobaculales bacterium]
MPITCSRCGQQTEAMDPAPLPTALGQEVQQRVCRACWQEWLRTQVMLINEHRLNLVDVQARRMLEEQMRGFLNLPTTRSG